ncbi:uncharacterized protein LOC100384532 [Zea mays]|uniref:Uncharacterized protein n=1 Tax=Zea mays TaxID=4577 RepID=C0P3J2_MAIZE|nr:uncharacterized protein LOC100384532 [Zea mays]ACN27558.1 unknown [Zea mays]ONM55048.1 hypothetical protein ZEAMMB73_Zm00001d020519 [Zea mays]|eukprot:NP_001307403.1 uncharacterized protein LOC100384532 [Zea mays]
MDDIAGERGRKGDDSSRAVLTPPRGPGLLSPSSPSRSDPIPSPPSAAVLALPAAATSPSAGLLASSRLTGEMDGGGETLLVRRSKGKKRRQPAAPAERGSGSGDRFRALWRDYHDLLQETEAKKRRLASKKRRSLALLAEVKFLRRKYQSFPKGGSQQTHYRLKKQARYMPSPLGHGAGTEVPSTSRNPNLDLNQDSVLNDVGNDCQGQHGHPEVEKLDQVEVNEDTMTPDVKLSVCRDTGEYSPVSEGKRAVPWQDRFALKT